MMTCTWDWVPQHIITYIIFIRIPIYLFYIILWVLQTRRERSPNPNGISTNLPRICYASCSLPICFPGLLFRMGPRPQAQPDLVPSLLLGGGQGFKPPLSQQRPSDSPTRQQQKQNQCKIIKKKYNIAYSSNPVGDILIPGLAIIKMQVKMSKFSISQNQLIQEKISKIEQDSSQLVNNKNSTYNQSIQEQEQVQDSNLLNNNNNNKNHISEKQSKGKNHKKNQRKLQKLKKLVTQQKAIKNSDQQKNDLLKQQAKYLIDYYNSKKEKNIEKYQPKEDIFEGILSHLFNNNKYNQSFQFIGFGSEGFVLATKSLQRKQEIILKVKEVENEEQIKADIEIMKEINMSLVVQFYESYFFKDLNNQIYVVYEFEKCQCTLQNFLDRTLIDGEKEDQKLSICHQIMASINYLHHFDIIHNDIKPENYLLVINDQDIVVKLSDFGLAVKLSANNQQFITKNADIFSVACVLTLLDNYSNFFQPQQYDQDKSTFIYPLAFLNMVQNNFNLPFDPSVFQDKKERINRKSEIYQYIQASVVFNMENRTDFNTFINSNLEQFYTNQVDQQKIIKMSQKNFAPDLRIIKIIQSEKTIEIDINLKELNLNLRILSKSHSKNKSQDEVSLMQQIQILTQQEQANNSNQINQLNQTIILQQQEIQSLGGQVQQLCQELSNSYNECQNASQNILSLEAILQEFVPQQNNAQILRSHQNQMNINQQHQQIQSQQAVNIWKPDKPNSKRVQTKKKIIAIKTKQIY
ncbi:hypothetical protein ABPG72_017698 [Tetrahymena utriculariae]